MPQAHREHIDDTLHGVFTMLTEGEVGTIVENTKSVGMEAWMMLHTRFFHKSEINAAEVSDQIRDSARPKTIQETFPRILEFERLIAEWEKNREKHYDEIEKEAGLLRQVPMEYSHKLKMDFLHSMWRDPRKLYEHSTGCQWPGLRSGRI